jgi:uncharacterized protein YqeY
MSLRNLTVALLFCALIGFALIAGCGKTEPAKSTPQGTGDKAVVHDHGDGAGAHAHDPHDVAITEADVKKPADFKDAVERIKSYRDAIERDTATATPGLAHRPLDELDIVLKWLPGIARDSNVPKSQWETINTTSQELQTLFSKVHTNIDEKKNPDFPSVAQAVKDDIDKLEKAAEAKE